MKCIVEVISDTLSKPNPLPISEECLETLRGGTDVNLILGISKRGSGRERSRVLLSMVLSDTCSGNWQPNNFTFPVVTPLSLLPARRRAKRCSKSGQSKWAGRWNLSSFVFPKGGGKLSLTTFCTKSLLLQMNESFLSFATKIYWRNFRKLRLKVQFYYSCLGRWISSVVAPCTILVVLFYIHLIS